MAKKKITIEQITMAETQLQTMQRQVDMTQKIIPLSYCFLNLSVETFSSRIIRGNMFGRQITAPCLLNLFC